MPLDRRIIHDCANCRLAPRCIVLFTMYQQAYQVRPTGGFKGSLPAPATALPSAPAKPPIGAIARLPRVPRRSSAELPCAILPPCAQFLKGDRSLPHELLH
eukprot:6202672-Pleurochrysis_carterae.AAC.1